MKEQGWERSVTTSLTRMVPSVKGDSQDARGRLGEWGGNYDKFVANTASGWVMGVKTQER